MRFNGGYQGCTAMAGPLPGQDRELPPHDQKVDISKLPEEVKEVLLQELLDEQAERLEDKGF